jgi:hypothetical protein
MLKPEVLMIVIKKYQMGKPHKLSRGSIKEMMANAKWYRISHYNDDVIGGEMDSMQ